MLTLIFIGILILIVYGVLIGWLIRRVSRIEQEDFLEEVEHRHRGTRP